MNKVIVYVEGGGDDNSTLVRECREAFSSFIEKAGLKGCMPKIIACGSRNNAYRDYCMAIVQGKNAILLVDSEGPNINSPNFNVGDIKTWEPWYHLTHRTGSNGNLAENWKRPLSSSEEDCHLMVQMMEAWFLADIEALERYYGAAFHRNSLPKELLIEKIEKKTIIKSLENATKNTTKGSYNKGNHSFKILKTIDPHKVMEKSPWADRFVKLLIEKMNE